LPNSGTCRPGSWYRQRNTPLGRRSIPTRRPGSEGLVVIRAGRSGKASRHLSAPATSRSGIDIAPERSIARLYVPRSVVGAGITAPLTTIHPRPGLVSTESPMQWRRSPIGICKSSIDIHRILTSRDPDDGLYVPEKAKVQPCVWQRMPAGHDVWHDLSTPRQ